VDAVVVGAGAVGLACARALALRGCETVVVEARDGIGQETSSRNSEVIHAGIYYPRGSRKAALCVRGKALLYEYLADRGIAHRRCGKLIVATRPEEQAALESIAARAHAAGVHDLERLTGDEVQTLEPQVRACAGLQSPSTGIFDSHQYLLALQADLEGAGGVVACATPLVRARACHGGGFELRLGGAAPTTLTCRRLINAAGLSAREVLAVLLGAGDARLPPQYYASGHYYGYGGRPPFSRLVYPVPTPGGLGIHATLDLTGAVRFGPDVRWLDAPSDRFDDSARSAFEQAIERYFPQLERDLLVPGYTGVRPKVTGPGEPNGDFLILDVQDTGLTGLVSLHGIESPGLTASLALAEAVVEAL
ncbi:MAG: NAD(P)/FAD-dependent oxidoreductase, partial [Pseudomonadota bacterium]